MSCQNPDCLCQDVEPRDFRKLSNRDLDRRYGMAISRLRMARDDVLFLAELDGGDEDAIEHVLASIVHAIELLDVEHRTQATARGFAIRGGIGPGDWRNK